MADPNSVILDFIKSRVELHNKNKENEHRNLKAPTKKPKHTIIAEFKESEEYQKDSDDYTSFYYVKATNDFKYFIRHDYAALGLDYTQEYQQAIYVKSSIKKPFIDTPTTSIQESHTVKVRFPEIKGRKRYVNYTCYVSLAFKDETENDCLELTERVLTGSSETSGECSLVMKGVDYHKMNKSYGEKVFKEEQFKEDDTLLSKYEGFFGNTMKHNIRMAKLIQKYHPDKINEHISVKPSEGITIMYMEQHKKHKATGYHAVPVVAKSGNWIITIEADSSDIYRQSPVFDLYSLDSSSGRTFYDTYRDMYGGKTAVVIPLVVQCKVDLETKPKRKIELKKDD